MRTHSTVFVHAVAALVLAATVAPVGTTPQAAPTYAIRGGRVFTAAGAPIDNGIVVVRDGLIVDVGPSATVPADAIVIDASGQNVYPGLIDMGNDAPVADPEAGAEAAPGGRAGGGGRGGGGAQTFTNREDAERAKRAAILRAHFQAAEHLQTTSAAQVQLANAGITTVLAAPETGIFNGQSALVNVLVSPDHPQISEIADYRVGLAVVKAPVASHINLAGRGGGQGYPQSLLGTIAFAKQELLNAQWQRDAQAAYRAGGARGARPLIEPALEALAPVLARELPAALAASEPREIDRALAIASEFKLDPIIVGAQGAADRTAELLAAKARVILSLNLPGAGGTGGRGGAGGGGGRGGGAPASVRMLKLQQDAPKIPARLAQAGVPFAFSSGGLQNPGDFVRNIGRVIRDGGLSADAALRAATIDAARIAGAADRTGSIERGKIANLVVTEGDLFDSGRVRHVFIDGRPIDLQPPAAPGRGGRGGGL